MNKTGKWLIIIFVSLFFIKPIGIEYLSETINSIYDYGTYFAFFISVVLFVAKSMSRKRISTPLIIFIVYMAYMVLNTAFQDGPVINCMRIWGLSFATMCLFESFKKNYCMLLRVWEVLLSLLCFINLVMILQYPLGMYVLEGTGYTSCWLLGYKSSFQYYFIPLLLISSLFAQYKHEWKIHLFNLAIIHLSSVLAWNAMFVVSILIYDVLFFLKIYEKEVFNVHNTSIVVIGTNVAFVFFSTIMTQFAPLYYFFNNILGKTNNLMIRFLNWNKSFEFILANPVFGYGHTTGREMMSYFHISVMHIHNQFLHVMLQGGGIGLILFVLIFYTVCKHIDDNHNLKASKSILLVLFALFISVVVEIFFTYLANLIWPITLLGYNIKELDTQFDRCKTKQVRTLILKTH